MSLCCCIILLDLVLLHQVVQHGKGHVRTNGTGTIAQKQSSVHHLAYLTTLDNQGCLHTLAHANQVVVNSRNGQQRGDVESPLPTSPLGEEFHLVS